MNDVSVAARALLPLDKPFLKATLMENMIAYRDLEQHLILLEEVQTHATLLLEQHVPIILWNRCLLQVSLVVQVHDSLHSSQVDPNYHFHIRRVILLCLFSEDTELPLSLFLLFLALLCVYKVKANNLDHNDCQKQYDRYWNEQKHRRLDQVLMLQLPFRFFKGIIRFSLPYGVHPPEPQDSVDERDA